MGDCRKLTDLAEHDIRELREQGHTVTDADVVLLNALAHEIMSPAARIELARGRPVRVGGVTLWPFTISAQHWFDRVGSGMPDAHAALAYAMAHGHREELWVAEWRDVLEWRRGLTCTFDQLVEAIAAVQEQDARAEIPTSEDEHGGGSESIAQLSMLMHAHHGGEVAEWERHVSCGYIQMLADVLAAQARERGCLTDVLSDRANLAYAWAIRKIKERKESGVEKID